MVARWCKCGRNLLVHRLRTELERLRHQYAPALAGERNARQLAEAQAWRLKVRLDERTVHIEDLQRVLAALTPAPDRAAIPQPAPPFQPCVVPDRPRRRRKAGAAEHGTALGRRCRARPPRDRRRWLRHVALGLGCCASAGPPRSPGR
ncbi:hypothetical protein OH738_39855 [Streptomyces hirsutus]|uniref:Transposase n=1 Tax=Streptomyces hirsutus TaxID=35620 RepID=A0ABZ1H263_9ACTN|nr:hypothetical protein [Streptomyces hirsutus]WTD72654.1 hypothetical protein OHB56_00645 [Streptomyces sp. NBC_01635]WSD04335.1 hypothetical protein OIE73_00100 [Streptomyces hirsutus]WSD11168.1 hypothetical protein OIE73_39625 [Streptomyces hirsutus]WTD15478.1 hypothetical protein OH738_00325 [Streptomyces hirsutus]WTD22277.1 hypothetical protein OH738_39855 [Streptomyces hirsutus]